MMYSDQINSEDMSRSRFGIDHTKQEYTSECFLCKKVSPQVVWREMGYEGRLCSCGLVYTHPKPSPGVIDYTIDHHPAAFYAYPAAFKARWVADHCPKGRLLEVGCGEGFFLAAAQSFGYEVFGLEPHSSRARRVRERLQIEVVESFLESHALPAKSFDVVYHCDLLAHFPEPLGALRTMSTLLRPGGVLCFEVGILGGISPRWYQLIGRVGLGYHLWLYSEQAVTSLLKQAGLRIEHLQHFGLAPGVIVSSLKGWLRRMAAPVLPPIASPTARSGARPRAQRTSQTFDEWFSNILRYRVGSIAPHIGPLTLLIVARPENHGEDNSR
jgi:SAM-dependent methyltransferase